MCFLSFVSDEPNEAGCRSKRKGSLTPVHAGSFFIYFFSKETPRLWLDPHAFVYDSYTFLG